ncbi:MAG: guanylate kinase [Candidatus Eisenbacteria bacterium]|nr:guanylate kinase [Candidatus Eisenbacteria bacterium]
MKRRAFPIVISGPSGSGKTTICRRVLEADPLIAYSVSVTTRPPRPGEVDREHYEFVSDNEFDALINEGMLAESAVVHGFRYGTRKTVIDGLLSEGLDVIMDLDVQGGMSMRKAYPESLLLFVLPPSSEELEGRLRSRGTDAEHVIATRLRNAVEEHGWADKYDHRVVNDDLDRVVEEVRGIIREEREKRTSGSGK